jgi:hypothetical protein
VKALFQSFFLMLAAATDRELARQVQYLKAENRILRDKLPQRITVTPQERQRLLKYGKPLGAALPGRTVFGLRRRDRSPQPPNWVSRIDSTRLPCPCISY